jgi:nucleotide-binding universal stress UspA family protein/predicted transcriptional regulator
MARTIVIPLDGSNLAEQAVPLGAAIAKGLGASLTLVRVVPWPEIPVDALGKGFASPELSRRLLAAEHQSAEEYLRRQQAAWSTEGLTVSTVIRDGLTTDAIHDVADELGAYAIVMGSHGRGGARRFILGSVAQRLLQEATIPVLLVREGSSVQAAALRHILVPLDGSKLAELAIKRARDILAPDGILVLERVVEPIHDILDYSNELIVDEVATSENEAEATSYLERLSKSLKEDGTRSEYHVVRGRPSSEIVVSSHKNAVDAIVMTTHGRTGTKRWLIGSVADEVFRTSDLPVLLISARTAAAEIVGGFSVGEVMTRDVEVIQESESVISALRKLLRRRVSGAPVVNARNEPIGVITERDLLRWHTAEVVRLSTDPTNLDAAAYVKDMEVATVGQVMTRPAVSIDVGAKLNAAIHLLCERDLRRLPVTDDGRLVGIVSRADVLKGMAEQWRATQPTSASE